MHELYPMVTDCVSCGQPGCFSDYPMCKECEGQQTQTELPTFDHSTTHELHEEDIPF